MNCDDICRLLDEPRRAKLAAAEVSELEAHLSRCTECALQYLASEHVASFRSDVPELPESLHEQARRLHAACEAAVAPRVSRRPFIVGGLLLLGGAATMFAAVPRLEPEPAGR